MTEGTPPADSTTDSDAGSTGDAVDQSQFGSVEEAEAFYRHRMSGKDRAHNAETAALRAQIEALKAPPATPPVAESAEAVQLREAREELAREREARQAEALLRQYPAAAGILGDSIVKLPVEKIAAIEAFAENGQVPPRVDPNMAPRARSGMPPQAEKPAKDMTKEELTSRLRELAPRYQEALKEGLL